MAIDKKAYALANGYTDETVIGGGAIKGKNCTISKIEDIDGGHRITFGWTLDNGTTKSQTLDVKDGADGHTPVKGVDYFDGEKGDKGDKGANGVDGCSPTVVENANNTESDYKLDITDATGTFTTPNLMGKRGIQGPKGERGETGLQGQQGIQGVKGDKGEDGLPFLIYKQYEVGIEEFNEADFPKVGLMFMVHVFEEGKGYPVYRYTADGTDTPYSLITYMNTEGIKGEKGDKGDTGEQGIAGLDGKDGTTYTPSIGTVTTVDSTELASASVSVNTETKEAVFNFAIPKGVDGLNGVQISDNETVENKTWSSSKIAGVETELNAKLGELEKKVGKVDNIPIIYNQNTDILAYALTCPQEKRTLVRIYSANATNNPYGVSTDTDFIYEIDKINFDDLFITVRAKDTKTNREFINTKNEIKWSGWKELATMDKVADSIIREGKSVLYNLNNVDNIDVAIDIAKSGYKPIAVSLYNSGTHLWFAQGMYFNDTVCNLSLRGVTPTSATNAECKVLVTYIKTS